jgi:lipopolysaccharide/colanic/teichoic acid biosynthesis glycosyltransferase
MSNGMPRIKRAFDLVIGSSMAIVLLPILSVSAICILIAEGRPIFYASHRRVDRSPAQKIIKFRTMRRDADRIANRDTVPVNGQRFLNLPHDSPLYTPIGRFIERTMLTEMPQLLHVLQGRLSVIGNRPLPDNVVQSLSEAFPQTERRFLVRCGLTGPVQLIGRDSLCDAARLEIEIAYCEAVLRSYSVRLDLLVLLYTVLGGLMSRFRLTHEGVMALIRRHSGSPVSVPTLERHFTRVDPEVPVAPPGGRHFPSRLPNRPQVSVREKMIVRRKGAAR